MCNFGGFFLGFGCSFAGFVADILFELFGFFGTGLEAINATFGVDNLFFAGEEGMRSGADLSFDKRIFFAVGPLNSLFGLSGRFAQERKIGLFVHEDDSTIVFRVN